MPRSAIRSGSRVRSGFTLIELLVVLAVAGVIIGISVPAVGRAQARREVMNARDSFVWLAARARMAAVERGSVTRLTLDLGAAEARVLVRLPNATDSVLESVKYGLGYDYAVALGTASGNPITICYDSRGYAMEGACTTNTLPDLIIFANAARDTARARILPLGQVERQ